MIEREGERERERERERKGETAGIDYPAPRIDLQYPAV